MYNHLYILCCTYSLIHNYLTACITHIQTYTHTYIPCCTQNPDNSYLAVRILRLIYTLEHVSSYSYIYCCTYLELHTYNAACVLIYTSLAILVLSFILRCVCLQTHTHYRMYPEPSTNLLPWIFTHTYPTTCVLVHTHTHLNSSTLAGGLVPTSSVKTSNKKVDATHALPHSVAALRRCDLPLSLENILSLVPWNTFPSSSINRFFLSLTTSLLAISLLRFLSTVMATTSQTTHFSSKQSKRLYPLRNPLSNT